MSENKLQLFIDSSKDEQKPWFKDGLSFKCTGCGQCCTGAPGFVWVEPQEIAQMAAHLNLSFEEFSSQYVRKVDDRLSLIEDSINYDCVFLQNNRCTIYPVRPKQCRTFPWWPSMLRTRKDWEDAAAFCEGITPNAPKVPYEEILANLDNTCP
jgi:Fe-S-cluster containining protein